MSIKEYYLTAYNSYRECVESCENKYEWVASEVLGLATYDGSLDEIFVKKFCEVCKCIADRKTFEYIESSQENYITYILVCQLLTDKHWIDWGTSIRGAWFDESSRSEKILEWTCIGQTNKIDINISFSVKNILSLIDFIEEEGEK